MIAPVKGRISSKFGNRIHPFTGKKTFHNGVDVAIVIGTSILAPEGGKITEAWDHEKGGVSIAMVGSSGRRYGFAHLSVRKKAKGDLVNEGDVIALSGNSGASKGPHIHFTVKEVNGAWVDPQKYFTF